MAILSILRSANEALRQSGADAVMIGRGSYGRPWIAASLSRALAGEENKRTRSEHTAGHSVSPSCRFLEILRRNTGLRVFRKHLGWYVENAPLGTAESRRAAKATLCRIESAAALERAVATFWSGSPLPIPAAMSM